MATRIGIDIGGTFTDLTYYDSDSREVRVAKVPTTPATPEKGALAAVSVALQDGEIGGVEFFLHGTTVGLNALLERRGAKVGLLATKGFRDTIEIRRGSRPPKDPLFWRQPEPLVPRYLRLPITERLYASGEIHTPLVEDDVREAAALFAAEGVTAVAVAFMNAYANPEHELTAERILRQCGFTGEISLSHRISREYREYERTSTTIVDAFVRGRMAQYLQRLETGLNEMGFGGTGLVTRSGGGSMTFGEAEQRPFETIMSGPVAGAEGAAELAQRHDLGDLVCADVGGTSFDTCLIVDGRPELLYEGEIGGWPLQSPWVDVRSIGAGGGSIAYIDEGGLLRVGPQSAGAVPGPACYARGGDRPAMTDAAHALGMLGSGRFESGMSLDRNLSLKALAPVARQLGLSEETLAQGIMRISAAAMAGAIRELTVERGIDPGGLSLLAFGGAGPLMGTLLATELQVKRVIVPPYAGNFSAWGLLGADVTGTRARTRPMRLDSAAIAEANSILAELFAELEAVPGLSAGEESSVREAALDVRYAGQEHTLTLSLAAPEGQIELSDAEIGARFDERYRRSFGAVLQTTKEIVSVRATLRRPLPRLEGGSLGAVGEREMPTEDAYSFTLGARVPFASLRREALAPGEVVLGPAVITESTATTYLDAGFEAVVDPSGCLFITRTAD